MSTILAVYFCEWVVETENSAIEDKKILRSFRSNKGASKQRRDQINNEIGTLRDLLPLPESARQRLSQLQIMSLSCVFIRKCNILQKRKFLTNYIYFLICVCVLVFIKMSIHRVKFLSDDDESLLTSTDTVICLFSVFNATPGTSSDSPCDFSQVIQS